MPALASVPPRVFRRILELDGWVVAAKDTRNAFLSKGPANLMIPLRGSLVAFEILESTLTCASMTDARYLELKETVENEVQVSATAPIN